MNTKVDTTQLGVENTDQPQAAEVPNHGQPQAVGPPQAVGQPQAGTKRALTRTISEPHDTEEPISKRRRQLSDTFTGIRESIVASAGNSKWKS